MTFTEGQIVELNSDTSVKWNLYHSDTDFLRGAKFRIDRIAYGLFEISIAEQKVRSTFCVTYDQAQKYFTPKGPKPKLTLRDLLEDEE